MKLVRRKRKREPRLCRYQIENYFVWEWFPSRPCRPGKEPMIPAGVDPSGPTPRKRVRRLRPRKGRPLIFLPPGWEQLILPFPPPFPFRK